jgi:hypothetical protein
MARSPRFGNGDGAGTGPHGSSSSSSSPTLQRRGVTPQLSAPSPPSTPERRRGGNFTKLCETGGIPATPANVDEDIGRRIQRKFQREQAEILARVAATHHAKPIPSGDGLHAKTVSFIDTSGLHLRTPANVTALSLVDPEERSYAHFVDVYTDAVRQYLGKALWSVEDLCKGKVTVLDNAFYDTEALRRRFVEFAYESQQLFAKSDALLREVKAAMRWSIEITIFIQEAVIMMEVLGMVCNVEKLIYREVRY